MRGESAPRSADRAIGALAAVQHGVVARRQLRSLGLSGAAIDRRVGAGRLLTLHRGVYAVGHAQLTARGRWMAAVLAAGDRAVLSHASAAALWGLRPTAAVVVDVTVPRAGGRARPGLRIHRARDLEGQTGECDRIPVTTPERTVLDLAATLSRRALERVLDQAESARLTDVAALDALARAHPGHRGARKLHEALHAHTPGTTLTRSELEERFLALCDDAGLARPRVNSYVEGLEVDFAWPQHRLIVETDGWRYHRTRVQFENDRRRDAALARAGYRTLRFSHRQITTAQDEVVRTLRAGSAGSPPDPGGPR